MMEEQGKAASDHVGPLISRRETRPTSHDPFSVVELVASWSFTTSIPRTDKWITTNVSAFLIKHYSLLVTKVIVIIVKFENSVKNKDICFKISRIKKHSIFSGGNFCKSENKMRTISFDAHS